MPPPLATRRRRRKVAAKAAEIDKEHNLTGKAATAAVSAGMGAMSLFGKAKEAVSKAAAEQQAKK